MKKIVVDTNILVASAYAPESASRRIVQKCLDGTLKAVLSAALKKEYDRILPRAIHTKSFQEELKTFLDVAEIVETPKIARVVPDDPEDDKLIAIAVASGADAIISNDQHLLTLDPYDGIRILQPSAFVKQLRD